jgi:hypothetical protein
VQPFWKNVWRLLRNLTIDLPYDPVIPLLGIYPKDSNTGYYKGICPPMFTAALLTVAKFWKNQDAPLLMNGPRKCGIYTQ